MLGERQVGADSHMWHRIVGGTGKARQKSPHDEFPYIRPEAEDG